MTEPAPTGTGGKGGTISVVIPVFNGADCLTTLYDRLVAVLDGLAGEFEIIFVDDRSEDGSWPAMERLAGTDRRVTAIRLSRNFGQTLAISAGLSTARGDWMVVMDSDLEDPPEHIPSLLEAAWNGADIVLAKRVSDHQPVFRRLAAKAYFRLLSVSSGTKFEPGYGSFSVISRKVADAFCQFNEIDRHYIFILQWLGFEKAVIPYQRGPRATGESSYTLRALIRHAISGVFFQTTIFLRWITMLGVATVFGNTVLALYFLYNYLIGNPPSGFTSVMVVNLFIGGIIILSIGTVGSYLGRVFEQGKGRPLYVIDEHVGSGETDQERDRRPRRSRHFPGHADQ